MLVAVVGAGILIVDVVAAARFVGLLLRPRGRPALPAGAAGAPAPAEAPEAAPTCGWRIQLGPLTGSVVPEPAVAQPTSQAAPGGGATAAATVGRARQRLTKRLIVTLTRPA